MFEYLMPSLVMRAPSGSLLEQTNRLIVQRQMSYASRIHLPWGISESAYNVRDLHFTYQYSSFGIPGLGLKRGLGESAVIAPYATGLAAMVDPAAAMRNFGRLAEFGGRGHYGYYEALDFTKKHLPENRKVAVVRAYMSHHQGMTIVAIANVLFAGLMRSRFHAEPMIQATDLLLQERTPKDVSREQPKADFVHTVSAHLDLGSGGLRRLRSPHDVIPATNILSNGRYAVMITAAGSGYSRWKDLAITRWREDVTRDDWGSYIFLRDLNDGRVWSAGYQPVASIPDKYRVTFSEDRVELIRRDGSLTTAMEVVVSAEDDAEVRRITISNTSNLPRDIELTSYAELVLAPASADVAHPAFSKLFVETSYLPEVGALVATRRRRSPSEPEIWAAQLMILDGAGADSLEVETDRARFIGRGRTLRLPVAMTGQALSGTVGTTLDPIFAMRRHLRIPARDAVHVTLWTLVATSREKLLDLIDRQQDANAFQRASTLAWTQAQVQLRHLNISPDEANVFQRLASHILYANGAFRPSPEAILRGRAPQSALWPQGISGDTPIVLMRIDDIDHLDIVQQVLRAHEYWRTKQISVDLVILNERGASYIQDLQIALETAVRASQSRPSPGEAPGRGSVFVLRTDLISIETRALLSAVARIVLVARRGSLPDQLARLQVPPHFQTAAKQSRNVTMSQTTPTLSPPSRDLAFANGLGGFTADGREYVTILDGDRQTPAPWINVVANPHFGFQVSTSGSGYTWSVNSREHQLTPWSNDPVRDPPGEAIYIRDEETGDLWGPTAQPIRHERATYVARHGRGYSRFEHISHGIELDLLQFVPMQDPIKISRLRLRNLSGRSRKLSVTTYVEWILGTLREGTAPYIVTSIDAETGAMFAMNSWNAAFAGTVAFIDLGGRQTEWSGDRRAFIGRNGILQAPAALAAEAKLSGEVGAGLDPCGALRAPIDLAPGSIVELVFFLGESTSESEAQALIARYRLADLDATLQHVTDHWADVLQTVQVRTPDPAMDIMLNGWLLYQTLACRFWARSAFYQTSDAFGFRDQLQDGMALALVRPDLTRHHLLAAGGRQFPEGDLQHWWLPPLGQGVRTRISDDRVWLAYAAAHYVDVTGDHAVLDEVIPFLEGPALIGMEHDAFFQPMMSEKSASLYEHCALAIDHSLAVGEHGLPLMGTGDWNDGMNRVGEGGKGESVWLGWFLLATLAAFIPLATARSDLDRVSAWQAHAARLREALEREAWDGAWYKRGYFDDGTPLGSQDNAECQIDSIAQSWAVLSGSAEPARAKQAMASVNEYLIQRQNKLALLFTPPFDQTPLDPGYIKGYPPGIRENGGQYTHAAAWTVLALAKLGDGNLAADLFALLNPINHAATAADIDLYKVEPYVIAADVYSVSPLVGRGGWTWYTGSAGWMYRAGLEGLLGFWRQGTNLVLDPCIPTTWPGFEITYKFHAATYYIAVANPRHVNRGIITASLDGADIFGAPITVPLIDDGRIHQIRLTMG
jgi:cyclic beta-1,2-glucan synthetase